MSSWATWRARCAASAFASFRAIGCAASSRRTTWTAPGSSTDTASTRPSGVVLTLELELIEAIEAALERPGGRVLRWVGDDAAVVRARPLAVISVDTMVDGVHFALAGPG